LLSALVVQTGAPSEGLQRQWDAPNTGVDKHHGYAFQWFALSALLVGLYGWFQWLAPLLLRRKNKRSPD
jgi:surfeit locus 1 family protein